MFKKIIAVLLVVTLTAALAIGGTLAYLTDRDSEANVFTVGDVNIDLEEDFNDGATLIPGVTITKKPTVTNEGPNEAWVWTTVAVPTGLASVIDFDGVGAAGWASWTESPAEIDGKAYTVYTVLHTEALDAGDVTNALFTSVSLDSSVDIDPNGNWYTVNAGVAAPLAWNNSNGNPVVYVSAYAMQAEGFGTVADAYEAYNTQWTTAEGVNNGLEWGTPATVTTASTAEELTAALAAGGNIVLTGDVELDQNSTITVANGTATNLNLNGHTLSGASNITSGNSNMVYVKGSLSVSNGTMTMEYTGANQGWNRSCSVFSVEGGELTLGEDVVIENLGGTDMAYGVDVNTTVGESILNINGATIKSTYTAVRLFNNNQTQKAIVNMNGGVVDGTSRDIWAQMPSASAKPENAIVNIATGITYATENQASRGVIYNFG